MRNIKFNIAIYILIAVFSFALGWQATVMGILDSQGVGNATIYSETGEKIADVESEIKKPNVDMKMFWLVWNEVLKKHIDSDKVSKEDMVYGAIQGMVNALDDPYTVYKTPEETRDFDNDLEGKMEGIGALIDGREGVFKIASTLKDSPAQKAGLMPDDIIFKVDGESVVDLTIFELVGKIRGKKGTPVVLTIIREELSEPMEVKIIRDSIKIDSVSVENLDDGIVYISVNQFNEDTGIKFSQAISDLLLKEPKGIIIDLRSNGGGYLETAIDILSHLLPTDEVAVILKEKEGEDKKELTRNASKVLDIPLVILVNQESASASEIVAGAIKDYKRGVIMGTKTFGKGSVQEIEHFSDKSSLKVTIAKWYTPNDISIDKVGLEPDILVELDKKDFEKDIDTQKEEAIKYLKDLKK